MVANQKLEGTFDGDDSALAVAEEHYPLCLVHQTAIMSVQNTLYEAFSSS